MGVAQSVVSVTMDDGHAEFRAAMGNCKHGRTRLAHVEDMGGIGRKRYYFVTRRGWSFFPESRALALSKGAVEQIYAMLDGVPDRCTTDGFVFYFYGSVFRPCTSVINMDCVHVSNAARLNRKRQRLSSSV